MEKFFLTFIFLELFELFWQQGDDFKGYIKNLYKYYKKGILLFILLHPTFYFILFSQMALQRYNLLISLLIFIKILDIGFKISLMDKIQKNRNLGAFEMLIKTNQPLSIGLKAIGPIFYITLFFFAFS